MDPFLGQIGLFPWNFAAVGWALCQGQLMPISQNTALYSLLGTAYGGNGTTNFGLPDLQGRTPVHVGSTYGHTGVQAGTENVTLSVTNLPAHTHTYYGTSAAGNLRVTTGALYGMDTGFKLYSADTTPQVMSGQSIGGAGGSQPHNNLQPFQVINFSIATRGYFPARN